MDDLELLDALYRDRVLPAYRVLLADVKADLGVRLAGVPAFDRIGSRFHGLGHWARVGCLALRIAGGLPRATLPAGDVDRAVTLAAFFHDSGRTIDGYEPGHAEAGAALFEVFAARWGLSRDLVDTVSTAIRLHEAPQSVVPGAGGLAIALANADRLDRVRLGDSPIPARMYDDGQWRRLVPVSDALLHRLTNRRAWTDVADLLPWPRDP